GGERRERVGGKLRVDGSRIERFAEDRVGFEKFEARRGAEFVEPEQRHIAEITEAGARGESQDFEAVFEKIGFGGDFELVAVILPAADDDEKGVDSEFAADDT